ncbi:MAG: NAD(P)/FAD-dependent oxidoreductase [Solirubrobacterales bacterium]
MAWNIVIAGAGFGGANAAKRLEKVLPKQSARLTVVNDVNFLLYTPFLPAASAGTLEPRHAVTPLREILRRAHLRLGAVTGHDPEAQTVTVTSHAGEQTTLDYDALVLGLGAVSRSLPIPGLDEHAIGFKSLADAIWLRNHVIETLEAANATADAARREQLLTYVFVGGGYAGLEALAELQDFAAAAMDFYPRARLQGMRWIMVEARDRVMPELDADLAAYTMRELRGRGVEFFLDTTLEEVTAENVTLSSGEVLPTDTVVWTAGVTPHPSLKRLSVPLTDAGKVPVDEYLKVRGMERVWAVGDCAEVPDPEGGMCPPTAQHAVRQGRTAAGNVAASLGIGERKTFTYKTKGQFADLGRHKGVGKVGDRIISGFPAWWMTRTYHITQVPSISRKIRSVADWTVSLGFPRDLSEVGSATSPAPLSAEAYEQGGTHRPLSRSDETAV